MAALDRVGLARFIDRVFSSRDIGARKPDPAFYAAVLDALRADAAARGEPTLRADEVVMVGDNYENDVAGALAAGLRGVVRSARAAPHGHAPAPGPRLRGSPQAVSPDSLTTSDIACTARPWRRSPRYTACPEPSRAPA